MNLFRREVAVVGVAGLEEFLRRSCVSSRICRLKIRPLEVGVTAVDANPREGVDDSLRPLWLVARLVGVFDSQDEDAVILQRENPVVQRSARPAHVKVARR